MGLEHLRATNNQLTELDVSNNQGLCTLHVSENQLTELQLKNNKCLDELRVGENHLTFLEFSDHVDVEWDTDIEIPSDLKFDKVKGCYTNE